MAAREPYKVHSLKKHIADTKSKPAGTPMPRPTSSRMPSGNQNQKNKSVDQLFGNADEESDNDTAISDDSSDNEDDFLAKLGGTNGATKRRPIDDEIADSDDERKAAADKKSKKHKTSPQKQASLKVEPESSDEDRKAKTKVDSEDSSSSSSDESSDDDDDDDDDDKNGPSVKTEAATEKVSQTSSEDSESSSESSAGSSSNSESESESESEKSDIIKAPLKKATNGVVKQPATSSSSSEEDDSDDDSDSSEEVEEPRPAPQSRVASKNALEPETSSSDDEDEDGKATEPEKLKKALPLLAKKDGQRSAVATVLHRSSDSTDLVEMCDQAKRQGKELWYFVAPSDAAVSIVHDLQISMDDARQGHRVVNHNGEAYEVSVNSVKSKSTIQIALPIADTPQYRLAPYQPSQIMHLKRLPQLGASSSAVGPSAKPKARVQPAGLSARFKPIGVYDPAVKLNPQSQLDTVMEDAPDVRSPASHKKNKKDKGSKKRKLTPSEEDAEAATYQLLGESQEAKKETKKPRTDRPGSPDLGSGSYAQPTSAQPIVTPAKKSKSKSATKEKKAKTTPSSSQVTASKQTPVPLPSKHSHVPLPNFPGSSQPSYPKRSPVPIPQPPSSSGVQSVATPSANRDKPKKSKTSKSKEGKGKEKRQDSTPRDSAAVKLETPVMPPVVKGMD